MTVHTVWLMADNLIAFTWQWVSAWTRQAWCDSSWVTVDFCSSWWALMNPGYSLPELQPSLHDWQSSSSCVPPLAGHQLGIALSLVHTLCFQTVIEYCQFELLSFLSFILESASLWAHRAVQKPYKKQLLQRFTDPLVLFFSWYWLGLYSS